MVTSITALRTRILNEYGVSGQKTTYQGHPALLVKDIAPTPEDKADYLCEKTQFGIVFVLNSINIEQRIAVKPLPTSKRSLAAACALRGINIDKLEDVKYRRPGPYTRGIVIPDIPCDYTEFTLTFPDDYMQYKELMLKNVTWIQSKNDEHRVKVLIMDALQRHNIKQYAVNDLLRQIAEHASIDDDTELPGWGLWADIKEEILSKEGWLR